MSQTNPNGANGTTGDPREQAMWDLYVKSLLNNTENAYKAAIDAGYSEDHARNITLQGWFKERKSKLKRKDMLSKAERNLDKVLDTEYIDEQNKIQSDVMRIVVDVSKTIVTTLGKDEGYSTRNEHTGKDGGSIEIEATDEIKKLAKLLSSDDIHTRTNITSDGVSSDSVDSEVQR